MKQYDVFISYRRDGGEHTAKIICDSLTKQGYRVFFDVESLRSGEFNQELYRVIETCNDFLVILSPGSLDRCVNEDDWVKQEISCAMKHEKNIVPVLLRNFKFPEKLPEEIEGIRWKNGVEASTEFYDAFIRKLTTFLVTRPPIKNRILQNEFVKKLLPVFVAVGLALVAVGGVREVYSAKTAVFPHTNAEKNLVKEATAFVSNNLSYANLVIGCYDDAVDVCIDYLSGQAGVTIEEALSQLEYAKKQIENSRKRLLPLDEGLSVRLDDTPLPKDDFVAVYTYLQTSFDGMEQDIDFLTEYLQEPGMQAGTQLRFVREMEATSEMEKNYLFYGINMMFLGVDPEAMSDFKREILPNLANIYVGQVWLTDKDEVEAIVNRSFNYAETRTNRMASLVGKEQQSLDQMKSELDQAKNGRDQQERDYILETYRPLDTDDAAALWQKLVVFNYFGMTEEALHCLDLFEQKEDSEAAEIFIPVARFFLENEEETGYDYGCLVGGFEDGKPPHRQLKVGDIVVAVNQEPVKDAGEVSRIRDQIGMDAAYTATVLRLKGDQFKVYEEQIDAGQALVLFYSLYVEVSKDDTE